VTAAATLYLPPWADLFLLVVGFATFRMWGAGIAIMVGAYDEKDPT